MKKLSSSFFLTLGMRLLILIVIAKSIALLLWSFLPSEGVSLVQERNYTPTYKRIDFKNMLEDVTKKQKSKTTMKHLESKNKIEVGITNMVLKALYGKGSSGYAIVALKSSVKKTSIVSVGEKFAGFTLHTILTNSILFVKDGRKYVLQMPALSKKGGSMKSSITKVAPSKTSEGVTVVTKKDIKSYANNPQDIMRDISIVEVREGNKIQGFKVTRIRKNSKMQMLGLMLGDTIIKANNITLTSYKDALNLYKKIDTLDVIQIVVKRNNEEKELIYEIH